MGKGMRYLTGNVNGMGTGMIARKCEQHNHYRTPLGGPISSYTGTQLFKSVVDRLVDVMLLQTGPRSNAGAA